MRRRRNFSRLPSRLGRRRSLYRLLNSGKLTARVVSTVQIGNYAILEGPENADHLAGTKFFNNSKFSTVESILPDWLSSEWSRFGGTPPESCLSVCLSPIFGTFLPQVAKGKRNPPSRSADQGPRPRNVQKHHTPSTAAQTCPQGSF